jgi:choline-glycine betaine transporter
MHQPTGTLRTLSIIHYVFGGINIITSCLPLYFVYFGLQEIIVYRKMPLPPDVPQGFKLVFSAAPYIFIAFGIAAAAAGLLLGLAMALTGRFLSTRSHFRLCHITAFMECVAIPAGTALGIFTIATIRDPVLRAQFDSG